MWQSKTTKGERIGEIEGGCRKATRPVKERNLAKA
jgi:hypothetical protein